MKIKFLITLIAVVIVNIVSYCQSPKIWGNLEPGPYQVGFEAFYIENQTKKFFSRDTLNIKGRPIRVLMWYPSNEAVGEQMRINEYIDIKLDEPTFSEFNKIYTSIESSKFSRLLSDNKVISDSLYPTAIQEKVLAYRNLPKLKEKTPLVVYSGGRNGSQLENFVLFEYLASYGFTVAVIPQLGASPGQFINIPWSQEGLSLHASDLTFTIDHLKNLNSIDDSKIGLIGYSSGGMIGSIIVPSREDIDLLVSLDGAITTDDGVNMAKTFNLNPKEFNEPVLDIYNANNHQFLNRDFINEFKNLYSIKMLSVTHFDFNQWPLYYNITKIPDERGLKWRTAEDAVSSYLLICELTREFLQTVFFNEKYKETDLDENLNSVILKYNIAEMKD